MVRFTTSDILFFCAIAFTFSNLLTSFQAPSVTTVSTKSIVPQQKLFDVYDAFVGANEQDPREIARKAGASAANAYIEDQEGGSLADDEDEEPLSWDGNETAGLEEQQQQPPSEEEDSQNGEENFDLPDDMNEDNDIGGDPDVDVGLNKMINVDNDDALYDDGVDDNEAGVAEVNAPVLTGDGRKPQEIQNEERVDGKSPLVIQPDVKSPIVTEEQNTTVSRPGQVAVPSNGTIKKPILLLHVGPRETGTPLIQNGVLRNETLMNKLNADGWEKVVFSYTNMQQMALKCFEKKINCRLWDDLLKEYDKVKKAGKNAIQSAELFSKIPFSPFVAKKLADLTKSWIVRIVVVYKPLYKWLPDMYTKERKKNAYDAKKQAFKLLSSRKKILPSIQSFPAYFENEFIPKMTDSLATYEFYSSVFGRESVVVLHAEEEMPKGSSGRLVEDFVCRAIPHADSSCSFIKANPSKPSNAAEKEGEAFRFLGSRLDYDLLAMEATTKKLIKERKLSTRSALSALEQKLNQNDMTITDIEPRISISADKIEWLWNRTLRSEEILLGSKASRDQETIQSEWKKALRSGLSSIDAAKVLESNSLLRDIFPSLGR